MPLLLLLLLLSLLFLFVLASLLPMHIHTGHWDRMSSSPLSASDAYSDVHTYPTVVVAGWRIKQHNNKNIRHYRLKKKQAIGIEVEDAADAYNRCLERSRDTAGTGTGTGGGGGDGEVGVVNPSVQPPTRVLDLDGRGAATISEVRAYGDVVLRFISFEEPKQEQGKQGEEEGRGGGGEGATGFTGAFLPNFVDVGGGEGGGGAGSREDFGLQRADHIVGNVWDMLEHVSERW